MSNIYMPEVLDWCREHAPKSYKNYSDEDILVELIQCYINNHNVHCVELTEFDLNLNLIEPVPFKYIMCAGKYIEVSPEVWRLVCTDKETYTKYSKHLSTIN